MRRRPHDCSINAPWRFESFVRMLYVAHRLLDGGQTELGRLDYLRECDNLPGFVVLDCGQGPSGGAPSWGSGFLPATHQGTLFTTNTEPIDYVRPFEHNPSQQQQRLTTIDALNRLARKEYGNEDQFESRIKSFEQAFRMQTAVPELTSLEQETEETKRLYGMDNPKSQLFGSRCLLARRLIERGVRFVEVFAPQVKADRWDQHGNLEDGHRNNAVATDRGVAGLLRDLKQRGMLNDTIVMWGGEFGRTPNQQGSNGRDHNPFGYTIWLAGGGFKPGIRHGQTDEFGYHAVEDKVHLHDLHATLLHQLGIDHELLTYRHSGRDFRLTDVEGQVVHEILS
jgi:hypothetical protein